MDRILLPALLYRRRAAGGRSDAMRRFLPDLYNTLCYRSGVFYPRPACVHSKPAGNTVLPVASCRFTAGVFPAPARAGRYLCPAVSLSFLLCNKKSEGIQKRSRYAVCLRAYAVYRLRYNGCMGLSYAARAGNRLAVLCAESVPSCAYRQSVATSATIFSLAERKESTSFPSDRALTYVLTSTISPRTHSLRYTMRMSASDIPS